MEVEDLIDRCLAPGYAHHTGSLDDIVAFHNTSNYVAITRESRVSLVPRAPIAATLIAQQAADAAKEIKSPWEQQVQETFEGMGIPLTPKQFSDVCEHGATIDGQ